MASLGGNISETLVVISDPVYTVKSYGAKGNGVTDDTAAIQAAITAAAVNGGVVFFPTGTYIVSPSLQPNSVYGCLTWDASVTLWGPAATIKIKGSSVVTSASTFILYPSGSPAESTIDSLTLDCNAANQSLSGMGSTVNLIGIASRNTGQAGTLRLRNVTVKNANTKAGGSSHSSGIGIDDYGFAVVIIEGSLETDTCDYGYFHTTITENSGGCWLLFDTILGHNNTSETLYVETCGQATGAQVLSYSDSPSGVIAVGIKTPSSGTAENVHIGRIVAENNAAITIGIGGVGRLDNSSFGVISMTDCPNAGGIYISQVTPNVHFGSVIADGTNAGSIVEVAGSTSTYYPVFSHVAIGSPTAGASLNGGGGPVIVLGGNIDGAVSSVTGAPSAIRNVTGYNPVGSVTVAVPASGTAVTAAPYDRTFYATAGTDAVTLAIENGPTVKIPANAMGTVRVPAGKTLTPTYTATHPPTWVVEGE